MVILGFKCLNEILILLHKSKKINLLSKKDNYHLLIIINK